MTTPDIIIEPYRGTKQGRQVWRWRAKNGGNNRKQANGGEAYVNRPAMIKELRKLFGPGTTVVMVTDTSQEVLREALPLVNCEHCGHSIVLHVREDGCEDADCPCDRRWAQVEAG